MTELGGSSLSVTRWIGELRVGDEEATSLLWQFLMRRMLRLARTKVKPEMRAVYDEEDVALSAFGAFCDAMGNNRYDRVSNRDELWRLIAVFVVNKARDRYRFENRIRRGGAATKFDVDELIGSLCTETLAPDDALSMREDCQTLLQSLKRPEVQAVALLKLDGFTNEEIAQELNCTRRAVQRRLALIRDLWSHRANGVTTA